MTATATRQTKTEILFSELDNGPVTIDAPAEKPAVEQVTFKRTGHIGGYIGYTMPTEFVECTVRLNHDHWHEVTARSEDTKWKEAVEEAVRLYELLDEQEPTDCDLEALRAEWLAYKEAAEPYTDAVVDSASCTASGIEFTRYCLAYIDKPLEMNTEFEEVIGLFSDLDSSQERNRLKEFISLIYSGSKGTHS